MVFIVINIIFIGVLFFVVKLRLSRNDDTRLLSSDYEFYATLPLDKREVYWKHSTKTVLIYLVSLMIIINIVVAIGKYFSDLQVLVGVILLIIIVSSIYCKMEIDFRRKISGRKKVNFFIY